MVLYDELQWEKVVRVEIFPSRSRSHKMDGKKTVI